MPSIRISDEMWLKLNHMKRVGESFDSVIKRLLEKYESVEDEENG